MLSIIILNKGEDSVVKLTYENLWKELKDIEGAQLLVADEWLKGLKESTNNFVCFVEPDCLVSSGYFASQTGLFKKNVHFGKLAMLTSATGVNNWGNRFYGYTLGDNYADGVIPVKEKKSNTVYAVKIGYVPGAVIRKNMLVNALKSLKINNTKDMNLVELSTMLSIAFWKQGDGNRVHLNPNATYVTTEGYVNDIAKIDSEAGDLMGKFKKEMI